MNLPVLIAAGLALILGLFLYMILVPKTFKTFSPELKTDDSNVTGLVNLSKDVYAAMPLGFTGNEGRKYPAIESLISRAGDPWGLKPHEFVFVQYVSCFIGLLIGCGIALFVDLPVTIRFVIIIIAGIAGYSYPSSEYNRIANERAAAFTKELPEALDLLTISVGSNMTFTNALRETIPNMKDSVLKDEFTSIVRSVDSGRTLDEALEDFQNRAPSDGIRTFVSSVRESIKLNTPLVDVLEARAEESREEYYAVINNKTAQLSGQLMAALTPTMGLALLIVVTAPSFAMFVKMV